MTFSRFLLRRFLLANLRHIPQHLKEDFTIRMARKNKNIVDYFPLPCVFSDSITAIEDMFDNNDGFVVWVKLLQKLGRSENHFVDCRNTVQRKIFFQSLKYRKSALLAFLMRLRSWIVLIKKCGISRLFFLNCL